MAISSTSSSTSATTTSSLDVASIVSQLMTAENKPIESIKTKITGQQLVISELGTIKSKVAALQDALGVFEDINTYGNMLATSDNTAVATATAAAGAVPGTYRVVVSQAAQKSTYNITGLASATDPLSIDASTGFQITVGSGASEIIYSSNGDKTVNGVTTHSAITVLGANPTATTLKDWINSLTSSTKVSASLSQMRTGYWALVVNGQEEGAANDFTLSGLRTGTGLGGFSSAAAIVTLDPTNGFQLTVAGSTYKTTDVATPITGTGPGGAITLTNLSGWINATATSRGLNISSSVTGGGSSYSLNIAQTGPSTESVTLAGIMPGAVVTGFRSAGGTELINLNGAGFAITVGTGSSQIIYNTNGDKTVGGVVTNNAITALGTNPTISDLKDWINNLSGSNISASYQGSGTSYALYVKSSQADKSVAVSGIDSVTTNLTLLASGFSTSSALINLDSVTGFELTVGAHTYSTLGKKNGAIDGTIPTLAANPSITALANWITSLPSAGVTGSVFNNGSSYVLRVEQAGAPVSLTAAGIKPNAIADGFSSATELLNFGVNGFSLTITSGGVETTYKTNGDRVIGGVTTSGAVATLSANPTLTTLRNWINTNIPGGEVSAQIVQNDSAYSLVVNANGSAMAVSMSGITSASTAITEVASGFTAADTVIALDATDGFQLTLGGTTYKTGDPDRALSGTGVGGQATLTNLKDWVNNLSAENGLNLVASITNTSGNYALEIAQTGTPLSISLAGLYANSLSSGFAASNSRVNLDPEHGFTFTVGANTYSTKGTVNGSNDAAIAAISFTLNSDGSSDLTSLKNWVNLVASAKTLAVNASVIGAASNYALQISGTSNATSHTLSMAGIVTNAVITGFGATNAIVALDAGTGVVLNVGGTQYSTKDAGTPIVGSGPNNGTGNAITLSDIRGWINGITAAHVSAQIIGSGSGYELQVVPNSGSPSISISGLTSNAVITGFSSATDSVNLNAARGFELTIGTDTYSTLGKKNGQIDNNVGTLSSATTLIGLKNWINTISTANSLNIEAVTAGEVNSTWQLEVHQTQAGTTRLLTLAGAMDGQIHNNFALQTTKSINSSNPSAIQAIASNSAVVGVNEVSISQTATNAKYTISGYASENDVVNLESVNGLQLTIGATTYKTTNAQTLITQTNGVTTLNDVKNWINNLTASTKVQAGIRESGGVYSLILEGVTGLANDFQISGVLANPVVVSGFGSANTIVALDPTQGFSVTLGGTAYKTSDVGRAITGTGAGSAVTLTDVRNWVNNLNIGLTASITGSGSAYSLNINQTGSPASLSVSGLLPDAINIDMKSSTANLNLNAGDGFVITVDGITYSTLGKKNGFTDNTIATLSSATTLPSLNNWINNLYTNNGVDVVSNIVGSSSNYFLNVRHIDATNISAIGSAGIVNATSSSNVALVTAVADPSTAPTNGIHPVQITQSAAVSKFNLSGFASTNSQVYAADFEFIVGDSVYYANGDIKRGVTTSIYVPTLLTEITGGTLYPAGSIGGGAVLATGPSGDTVTFSDLHANDRVTIAGKTLVAFGDISADTVAAAFLNDQVSFSGYFEGGYVDWVASSSPSGNQVIFQSTQNGSTVYHLQPSDVSADILDATVAPGIEPIDPSDPSQTRVRFSDLSAGQTLHFSGAQYTFDTNMSADEVALFVANSFQSLPLYSGNYSAQYDFDNLGAIIVSSSLGYSLGNSDIYVTNNQSLNIDQGDDGNAMVSIIHLQTWINNLRKADASAEDVEATILTTTGGDKMVHVEGTVTGEDHLIAFNNLGNMAVRREAGGSIQTSAGTYLSGTISLTVNGGVHTSVDAAPFSLKGTTGQYQIIDDPRGIVYDGTTRMWQGPASAVDPNYVNDLSRGQFLSWPNTDPSDPDCRWIGQPGVVLDLSAGTYTELLPNLYGSIADDGVVIFDYDILRTVNGSPGLPDLTGDPGINSIQMSRDAKGKIDGVYFQSATNVITNAGNKRLNLTIHQEINPFDQAQSADVNVSAGNPQSNTPSVAAPSAKSVVKDISARDTVISINGVTTTQANTKPITVNGITYNYFGSVAPGGSALTSIITIKDPRTVSNSAIIADPPVITGSPTTFSSNTPASSFSRQVASVVAQSNASVIAGSGLNIDKYSEAQDARVTIGGILYQRSSNVISDIIPKVTFTLMGGAGSANVNVSLGKDNSEKAITDLSDAYNAVIKAYNTMTANNVNSKTPGTFATSPTTLSFIENIKRRFATGATYNIGTNDANGNPYILSLASLGLDYQLDGTLKYNSIEYLTSQANGLREKFLKGLRIGYVSATDNLMTFVKAQSGPGGALAQEITIESNSVNSLTKEQENLQSRLNKIQDNYIAQYSGLNSLLFQLNSTSTNLGSALNALTNMAASK